MPRMSDRRFRKCARRSASVAMNEDGSDSRGPAAHVRTALCCAQSLALGILLGSVVDATPVRAQQSGRSVVAVFAHPDDERIVGPLLARYAREGHRVYLVIATDGRKGTPARRHPCRGLARCSAAERSALRDRQTGHRATGAAWTGGWRSRVFYGAGSASPEAR